MNRTKLITIVSIAAILILIGSLWQYSPFQYGLRQKVTPAPTIAQGGDLSDSMSNTTTNAVEIARNNNLTLTDLFKDTQQSVVQVSGTISNNQISEATLGSGFVYDKSGDIVTNFHVVEGSGDNDISITLVDGTTYRARVVGADQYSDIAVLHVEDVPADKLIPLPVGNSSELLVGERVVAIGNPFGLSGSMTEGIISGLNRLIPVYSGPGPFSGAVAPAYSIPDVIQTDAAINPGNSGGPLLDLQGEVVGINSAIFSTTGGFAGIGFAIPSNTIAKVVPSLITTGSFEHPWLGVSGIDMTPEIAEAIGLGEPRGFLVIETTPGGPAATAGVQGGDTPTQLGGREIVLGGDVILSIDDKEIRKIDDVLGYLQQSTEAGETVKLTVWRDGQIMEIDVTLGARPSLQESP
ncbi:MAG TPA: trypsin-like peptidase domain-containing protein [Nitrososphaeraceae archaeon]|nr:trypsin-like peptidase domain-containing protein [Nitrososphaeraceae archaeon]